jgi:hypothetical protein
MPDQKARRPAALTVSKAFVAGLCLLFAGLTLWLAVPRAVASVILFRAESTLLEARLGRTLPPAKIDSLLAAQRSALSWSDAADTWIDNGYTLLYSTLQRPKTAKQVTLAAGRALERGLSRMPVNAEGWYWLAVVRHSTSGVSEKSASALRMSVFTGPHIPILAVVRLRLMMRLWSLYDADERAAVYRHIRYSWSVAPDGVVDIALGATNDWPIRIALALQPKDLARFEAMLNEAKKKAAKSSTKTSK